MKPRCFALLCNAFMLPFTSVHAQSADPFPFAKGHWQYTLMQNFSYSNMRTEYAGPFADQQTALLNLGADYFVTDGFGIGLSIAGNNSHISNNGFVSTTSQWTAYGNLEYGFRVGQSFDMYGKAGLGFGDVYTHYVVSGSNSKGTFGIAGYSFELGAPIHLSGGSPAWLTPAFSWTYANTKESGQRVMVSGIQFGLSLQTFLGCSDYQCDGSHGFSNSKHMYDQGHSFIDFTSTGQFGFGTIKTTLDNSTAGDHEDYNLGALGLTYGYYILPYIAAGAGILAGTSANNDDASGTKTSSTSWQLAPMVQFNLPVENGWNNAFLKLQLAIGSIRSKQEYGSNSSIDKQDMLTYTGMVGYNYFIAKKLALTPRIGYEWENTKDVSAGGDQTKAHGLVSDLGIRLFL
jgi:hypothetical protein